MAKQSKRVWGLLAALAILTPSIARAGVELVQLTTANIDLYVTGEARKVVVPGDVVLRNDMVSVAVLTGSSKNDTTRSGRCVVLSDTTQVASAPIGQLSPGPQVPWARPEAGSNPNLAVLRFYRTESTWTAELTYRLRDGVPWVEISSAITNRSPDRTLEIPLVDRLETLSGSKAASPEGGLVTMESTAGPTIGYVGVGVDALAEEGRGGWNVGLPSGDPLDGAFRRASMRVLSMGRQSTAYMPIEAGRDWGRSIRDRQSWHRLEAKKDRTVTRRLLIASTANQLGSIVPIARESKPSGMKPQAAEAMASAEPRVIMPTITPPAPAPQGPKTTSAPSPKPSPKNVLAGKRRPTATPASNQVASKGKVAVTQAQPAKITGKLRGDVQPASDTGRSNSGSADIELPDTIIAETDEPIPSLPSKRQTGTDLPKVEKPKPVTASAPIDDADFAPTIDAIEELPPPEE
jgi:hypothetical protein